MRSAQDIFARILNRVGVLKYYNLNIPLHFNGRKLLIPVHGKEGFSNLYTIRDHDFHVYEFFKKEMSSGTFLDVGANIGQTLLKIVSLNPQQPIVCVEPSPACVNYLQELKTLNSLDKVSIIPAAIFDENGIRKLYTLGPTHTGASLNHEDRPNWYGDNAYIMVNSITGVELAQQISGRVSFLKVDVEGAELPVLKTLRDIIVRDRPVIFCEVLDAHESAVLERNDTLKEELYQYLVRDLNYIIYRLDADTKKLNAIDKFPSRTYSSNNLDECNYVFVTQP